MKRLHRNNNTYQRDSPKLKKRRKIIKEQRRDISWSRRNRHSAVQFSLSQHTGAAGFSLTCYLSRRWRVKVSFIFFLFHLLQQVEAGLKLFPKQRQVREKCGPSLLSEKSRHAKNMRGSGLLISAFLDSDRKVTKINKP